MARNTWKSFEKTAILCNGVELVLIEAESLSMKDKFMRYRPRTRMEVHTKSLIINAIEANVKNFYRPIMDPSLDNNRIVFIVGRKPAVGKYYNYWVDAAKKYAPALNSRLGTRLEYGAFLGVLIKQIVKSGKSVRRAWSLVCNDSKKLGHYHDSKKGFYGFESTGSRCICGLYDLVNVRKILAKDTENGNFYSVGGSYECPGFFQPLATIRTISNDACDKELRVCVGWIVFSQEAA